MKGKNLLFMLAVLAIAGCNKTEYVEYDEYDAYFDVLGCGQNGRPCDYGQTQTTEIKYVTNGNDLILDTPKYVIQVEGDPNKKYEYYVWAGDKEYTDDPDLIIQDGNAAVLVVE